MTEAEKTLARALAQVTFCPGIGTKRFARDMAFNAGQPQSRALTERQRQYLLTAVVRFRRQIPRDVVELARQELGKEVAA